MKILFVIHQFYPEFHAGTEKVTLNIASMLQNSGHKVSIATYCSDSKNCDSFFDGMSYQQYIYSKIPVMAFHHDVEPIDLQFGLIDHAAQNFARMWLEKENPDIVHVMHPMRMCGFIAAAQELGIPTVITTTDLMYVCPKIVMRTTLGELCSGADGGQKCNKVCGDTGATNHQRMEIAKQYLTTAKAVTSPSSFIKNMILQQMPDIDIKILHHGMLYNNTKSNLKYYNDNSLLTIGFIGTMEVHKGLHYLLAAFSECSSKTFRLKVYGNYHTNYGETLYKKYKNHASIEFCGEFAGNEINEVYSGLDMVVIPSLCYESYSLVKHESIIRNIPVAVSNLGALGEEIENGKNGFVFSVESTKALTDILGQLSADPRILNNIKACMKMMTVPTVEQESFAYFQIYKSIFYSFHV